MNSDYYYKILGLSKGASEAAIKEAYRRKAKKFHPDINAHPNAKHVFIEITEAYQYLLARKALNRKIKDILSENGYFDQQWEEQKRSKAKAYAQRHAKMKYEKFENSYIYKSAKLFATIYDYIIFFLGILSIISSISGVILTYKAEQFTADTVFIAFFGILIGVLFIFSTYKKFRFKK